MNTMSLVWRRKQHTPNTNDRHMPLKEPPPWKFSVYGTASLFLFGCWFIVSTSRFSQVCHACFSRPFDDRRSAGLIDGSHTELPCHHTDSFPSQSLVSDEPISSWVPLPTPSLLIHGRRLPSIGSFSKVSCVGRQLKRNIPVEWSAPRFLWTFDRTIEEVFKRHSARRLH